MNPKHWIAQGIAGVLACGALPTPASAMNTTEFEAARGEYQLSDGRKASLGGTARRPRWIVDGLSSTPLVETGPGRFVTADHRARIELTVLDNGLVSGLRLTPLR